ERVNARHVYHLYVVRVPQRAELMEFLSSRGIASGLHYPVPLHLQPATANLGYKKGDFPLSERICDEILSLPMYPELSPEQIELVCSTIGEFYSN
ncbi:MAG: DegT/DnrJ/EryC1/StrS family aminotransferase, partial [Candidatus Cloacimonetes bacterium]|nr:DegT/DnrJ/EryC1/StrS family aminotransferase [Candidatus Cloacimonadota bacterium]